jgi:branched-chain amino acid aminotransferase
LGLNPLVCERPQVIIIAATIQLYPRELYEEGLRVFSANTMRSHPLAVSPQIKSLNYLNNILAKLEGLDHGVLEVIMYNHQGYVAEASGDNVFMIKGERVCTPPSSAGALEGITRGVVMKLARQAGYEVMEANLTRYDLYVADEMFLTGTAAEVIGVVEIDGRKIGVGRPGPITQRLRQAFSRYVRA